MKGRTFIGGQFLAFLLLCVFVSLTTACFTIVADDTRQPEQNNDVVSNQPGGAVSSSSNTQSQARATDDLYELYLIAYPQEGADFLVEPKPDSQGAYPPGTTVTIDVKPRSGWEIEQWLGPVYAVSGGTGKIKMEQDQTVLVRLSQTSEDIKLPVAAGASDLAASPVLPAFTLTVNGIRVVGRSIELDNGIVEVSPDPQLPRNLYERGTTVKLTAATAGGYRLVGWSGDCYTNSSVCELAMNSDKNVAVAFEPLEELFGLTVVLDPEDGGEVEVSPRPDGPSSLYLAGTTVELEAVAEKGFRFSGWEGDCSNGRDEDDDGDRNKRCRVVMDEGKRVVASFSRK